MCLALPRITLNMIVLEIRISKYIYHQGNSVLYQALINPRWFNYHLLAWDQGEKCYFSSPLLNFSAHWICRGGVYSWASTFCLWRNRWFTKMETLESSWRIVAQGNKNIQNSETAECRMQILLDFPVNRVCQLVILVLKKISLYRGLQFFFWGGDFEGQETRFDVCKPWK